MELTAWQVELLAVVPTLLAAGDDALPRDAYLTDPQANTDFRRYTEEEAADADAADVAVVHASLADAVDGVVLTMAEAEAWLRAVGKARLVLGDRLGVKTGAWESDDAMEESPELELLHYLSWIHSSLVDAVSDLLPA